MNNDERIDDLLKDLDTALSVEPSPAVVVRVRTAIATEARAPFWFRFRWQLAGVATVALVATGYLVVSMNRAAAPTPAEQVAAVTPTIVTPPQAPPVVRAQPNPRVVAPVMQAMSIVEREPQMLISPTQRFALRQFYAQLSGGRVDGDTASDSPLTLPDPLVYPTVELQAITVDRANVGPVNGGGSGSQAPGGGTLRNSNSRADR